LRHLFLGPGARVTRVGIRSLLAARPGLVLHPPDWQTRFPETRRWWRLWA
jgi:hypothetical protein